MQSRLYRETVEKLAAGAFGLHNIEMCLLPENTNLKEKNCCGTDFVLTEKGLVVLFLKAVFNII